MFQKIKVQLKVVKSIISWIIQYIKQSVVDLTNFDNILVCLEDVHGRGIKHWFSEDSVESEALWVLA